MNTEEIKQELDFLRERFDKQKADGIKLHSKKKIHRVNSIEAPTDLFFNQQTDAQRIRVQQDMYFKAMASQITRNINDIMKTFRNKESGSTSLDKVR